MTMTRINATTAVVMASALLLCAGPAPAADGEVLISQARIIAGGITPGDTAGFPATLSQPGRYKLSSNLRVPAGQSGITVSANDVTLDLNGFTIFSESSTPSGYGIYAHGAQHLRVLNGTITGFGEGSYHETAFGNIIEKMRYLGNGYGVHSGKDITVRNSTIANNGNYGITCGFCRIEGNVITGNGTAVLISDGAGWVVGNVIAGNAGYAILSNSKTGYANNILVNNGSQVNAQPAQLHPNVCEPACP
jgi:hypothetical protein